MQKFLSIGKLLDLKTLQGNQDLSYHQLTMLVVWLWYFSKIDHADRYDIRCKDFEYMYYDVDSEL